MSFNFIENLLDLTKEAESPKQFFYWSALASLSAVVKRNVYIKKKIYRLYPNIYVMLVARSGLRKGYPVIIARDIVERTNTTKVISGRNSIQAILLELSKQYSRPDGSVVSGASAFINSGELNTLLIEDPSSQTILTDLYDSNYNSEWVNTLKGEGKEKLKDLYITMLTATNQTHLKDFLQQKSISGGFIARTHLIYADKKSHLNALIDDDSGPDIDMSCLVKYLQDISKLKGNFKLTDGAKTAYKIWYKEHNDKMDNGHEDITGTSDRLHDHVLKIAMLLSLAERMDLTIEKSHIEQSILDCTAFIISAKRVSAGEGSSENKNKIRAFMECLIASPNYEMPRKEVLRKRYGDFDAYDLDKMIETLTQAGIVERRDTIGGIVYKLSAKALEI